jgi:hypothetical protein
MATRDANGNELGQSVILTIDLVSRLRRRSIGHDLAQRRDSTFVEKQRGGRGARYVRPLPLYSTAYDVARGVCTTDWVVEGTTVSDGFLPAIW